jgi:AcrR family transcriptional regulator
VQQDDPINLEDEPPPYGFQDKAALPGIEQLTRMSVWRIRTDMSVLARRSYLPADRRRAQILDCARQVFARRGYHTTHVADICQAAGIGRGTLYQYFENKHAVFAAVIEDLTERIRGVVDARPPVASFAGIEETPPRLIVAFCERRLRELLREVFADEATLRLVLREARGLGGGIDHMVRAVDDVVLGVLEADLTAAARAGLVDLPDAHLVALFVLGGVEKMVLRALEADEPVDLDEIVRVATQVELFGLLSAQTRARGGGATPSPTARTRPRRRA